ncbi:cobalt ECF transporter T component CbiQ [Lentilactobacillus raoultii]|uniref:Cobalt ECF transporter T component CbiQ n=1 Tax=Lentilactobacillus raoultii TaxID=1987503 RepID=A0ABW3PDB1_9LACO|nr:cobalt ECF transporter T component CbiQ [Lentilactobacillus raoultii]
MLNIDKYAYNNRILRWSPKLKGMIWLLGILIAFQPMSWLKLLLILAFVTHTLYVDRLTLKQYMKWFYAVVPFIILSVFGIILTISPQRQTIYFPIRIFNDYFGISKSMWPIGLHVGLQVTAAIVCTYWFALTTPFQQIIIILKALRLPSILIEETLLMYRFIFIFIEAFEQIYQAQKLRFGYQNFRLSIHSAGILLKMLFEQVMINYRDMEYALEAKLFNGDFKI